MNTEDLRGRVLPLADLVDYQEGSVVSRTLLQEDKGSVTAFAFDEGQALSEHTVPHDALVYVHEGEVEITISGEPHRLTAGDMVLMPGKEPHAVKATAKFKMILTMIRA